MYERLETNDGSFTYRQSDLGVTYRSLHGATTESRHVFLTGTRLAEQSSPWRVLELGFGTGLNFQETCRLAESENVALEYVSLEPSPLPSELWLVDDKWRVSVPDKTLNIGQVSLRIISSLWQDFSPKAAYFKTCFHDPFGPGPSPECWEAECFRWSYNALCEAGVLATFGASTGARQAMKDAGYFVGSLPGAGGKRQMTVASKSEEAIAHAKAWKRH